MKSVIMALTVSLAFSASAWAEADTPHISDVMKGATALTTLRDGTVLVSKPDGGFICALDIVDLYFQVLAEGRPEIVRQPAAVCTSVDVFKNLGEN